MFNSLIITVNGTPVLGYMENGICRAEGVGLDSPIWAQAFAKFGEINPVLHGIYTRIITKAQDPVKGHFFAHDLPEEVGPDWFTCVQKGIDYWGMPTHLGPAQMVEA